MYKLQEYLNIYLESCGRALFKKQFLFRNRSIVTASVNCRDLKDAPIIEPKAAILPEEVEHERQVEEGYITVNAPVSFHLTTLENYSSQGLKNYKSLIKLSYMVF